MEASMTEADNIHFCYFILLEAVVLLDVGAFLFLRLF